MGKQALIIDITDAEVRLLRFSLNSKVKDVQTYLEKALLKTEVNYDQIRLPDGMVVQGIIQHPEEFISFMDLYINQLDPSVRKLPTFLALPAQHGFIRHFTLPWIAARYRQEVLSHLVEEEVPFPVGDKLYDFQTLSESSKDNNWHIIIGAARNSVVESYVKPLQNAGLKVKGVGFPFLNLGHMLKLKNEEQVVFLDAKQGQIQLVIFNGRIPEVVRTFTADSNISELVALVRRVLMYYALQHNQGMISRLIANGREGGLLAERLVQEGVAPFWEEASDYYVVDSIKPMRKSDTPQNADESFKLTLLCYAAACNIKGKTFNLFSKLEQMNKNIKLGRIALTIGIFSLLAMFISLGALHRQKSVLADELKLLSQEGQSIRLDQERSALLTKAWTNVLFHPIQVGDSLAKIQTKIPPSIKFTGLDYRQGGLNLRGTASAPEDVETVMKELKEMGWTQPILISYRQEGETIEFTISSTISPKK